MQLARGTYGSGRGPEPRLVAALARCPPLAAPSPAPWPLRGASGCWQLGLPAGRRVPTLDKARAHTHGVDLSRLAAVTAKAGSSLNASGANRRHMPKPPALVQ